MIKKIAGKTFVVEKFSDDLCVINGIFVVCPPGLDAASDAFLEDFPNIVHSVSYTERLINGLSGLSFSGPDKDGRYVVGMCDLACLDREKRIFVEGKRHGYQRRTGR